jgi:hypothetical protein
MCRDKSFADDLIVHRGVVSSRVALLLRSAETKPLMPRFVPFRNATYQSNRRPLSVRPSGGILCLAASLAGCLAVWPSGCLAVLAVWLSGCLLPVLGSGRRRRVVLHCTVTAADKPVANRIGTCRCVYVVPTPDGGCGDGGVLGTCERSVFERGSTQLRPYRPGKPMHAAISPMGQVTLSATTAPVSST